MNIEMAFKVQKAKMFMRLKVHEDGIKPAYCVEWQNVVAFVR
jgi:hypothetical protein